MGARYSSATASSSDPPVTPASTKSTNFGQAEVVSLIWGAAAKASSYEREVAVASVQITPTRPVLVAATARRAAGRMTSVTGIEYRSRASLSTAADALLHAMTSDFTPRSTRWSRHC